MVFKQSLVVNLNKSFLPNNVSTNVFLDKGLHFSYDVISLVIKLSKQKCLFKWELSK